MFVDLSVRILGVGHLVGCHSGYALRNLSVYWYGTSVLGVCELFLYYSVTHLILHIKVGLAFDNLNAWLPVNHLHHRLLLCGHLPH